jgi:hypothetical protein
MNPTRKAFVAITATTGLGLLLTASAHAAKIHTPAPIKSTTIGRASTVNPSGSTGGYSAGYKGGYSGGYSGGYKGGYYGGYNNRYYGNYYGGYNYSHYSSCGNWWYPWSLSFSYVSTPAVSYYPAPVYYSSTPVVYSAPTVVYSSPPAAPTAPPVASAPPTDQPKPLAPADVVALVKAAISDELIISQIRNSRTVYHLTAAEIIDLKNNGVSEKVIEFMINTAGH